MNEALDSQLNIIRIEASKQIRIIATACQIEFFSRQLKYTNMKIPFYLTLFFESRPSLSRRDAWRGGFRDHGRL